MAKRSNRQKERESKDANQKYYVELAKEDPTAVTRKETITDAMKKQNVTMTDLAKKTGLNIQSLMLFLNGRTNVSSKYATAIASFLQLEPESIMKMPDLTSAAINEAGINMRTEKHNENKNVSETENIEENKEESRKESIKEEKIENEETEKPKEDESKIETMEKEEESKKEIKEGKNEWVPTDMEMNAILTLCTDIGKKEVYNAIWAILQNPKCRKGALC